MIRVLSRESMLSPVSAVRGVRSVIWVLSSQSMLNPVSVVRGGEVGDLGVVEPKRAHPGQRGEGGEVGDLGVGEGKRAQPGQRGEGAQVGDLGFAKGEGFQCRQVGDFAGQVGQGVGFGGVEVQPLLALRLRLCDQPLCCFVGVVCVAHSHPRFCGSLACSVEAFKRGCVGWRGEPRPTGWVLLRNRGWGRESGAWWVAG